MVPLAINGTLLVIIPVALFVLWRIAHAPAPAAQRRRVHQPAPVLWRLPYRKQDALLSQSELALYDALCDTVAGQCHVFPKVRLADLVWVPRNMQTTMQRTLRQHVDFVLCDREWLAPVLVVELDDDSHRRAETRAQDAVVDHVLRTAGVPLLRVLPQPSYVATDLAGLINDKIRHRRLAGDGNGDAAVEALPDAGEPAGPSDSAMIRSGNGTAT